MHTTQKLASTDCSYPQLGAKAIPTRRLKRNSRSTCLLEYGVCTGKGEHQFQTCYINSSYWPILWYQRRPDKQQLSCSCSTVKHFTLIAHCVMWRYTGKEGRSFSMTQKQLIFTGHWLHGHLAFPRTRLICDCQRPAKARSKQLSDNQILTTYPS